MDNEILIVLVTYNPNWVAVVERVNNFSKVGCVFISDNSDKFLTDTSVFERDNIIYHYNNGNVGIARAQNIGINYALRHDYNYVAFIDDDSDLTGDKILNLLCNYHELSKKNENIAAYCAYPSEQGGLDIKTKSHLGDGLFQTQNLMSSGSVTKLSFFEELGLFKEELFIDFVDYEWGWRAIAAGYLIIVDPEVRFEHHLGMGKGTYGLGIPSPIRHFFQTRNLLWMLRESYVPLSWKIKQFLLLPVRFILYGFCNKDSKIRRENFLRGFAAGLKIMK